MLRTSAIANAEFFLFFFTILFMKMFFVKLSFSQNSVSDIKCPSVFVFITVKVHAQIEFFSSFMRAYVLGDENYKCLKPNIILPPIAYFLA